MASVDGLSEWIDLGQNLYIGWAGVGESWGVGLEAVVSGWRADPILELLCIPVYAPLSHLSVSISDLSIWHNLAHIWLICSSSAFLSSWKLLESRETLPPFVVVKTQCSSWGRWTLRSQLIYSLIGQSVSWWIICIHERVPYWAPAVFKALGYMPQQTEWIAKLRTWRVVQSSSCHWKNSTMSVLRKVQRGAISP